MFHYLLATSALLLTGTLVYLMVMKSCLRAGRHRQTLSTEQPDFDAAFWNGGPDNANAEPELFGALEQPDDTDVIDLRPPHASAEGVPTPTEYTSSVEPDPLFGTRGSVRNACSRAAKHLEKCKAAADVHDFAGAEVHAYAALAELEHMGRDHWFAPRILTWLGYLRYEQGFTVEARDYWQQAEQIALEWHEQCSDMLPVIKRNLQIFHDNF